MSIIINLAGLVLIATIVWWFWFSKPKIKATVISNNEVIKVKVKDGVYDPATIQVKVNAPFTLQFFREDASPCAESVVFATLNVSASLALNQPTNIHLTIPKAGEYEFTCQMAMYRGRLLAK